MDPGHQLKSLLQLQLASDASAVIHLAYTLQVLDKSCFTQNPHLVKWTTRIGSLLHSKDAGGRWAGLCLAHKSSLLSRELMVDSASSWIPVALPMLIRNESPCITKAAARLLVTVFTAAFDMPEFQRQISTPNIPKFTSALANIAANTSDIELRTYCLETLSQIIPIYPAAHKTSFANLSALTLGFLNGSHPCPTNSRLLNASARLYASLHLTGGKVGAAAIWRKAMDDTLAFGWNAYLALRTTFPTNGINAPAQSQADPAITAPLNLDRLRCCSVIVQTLLEAVNMRPVQISCGQLLKFGLALISSSTDDKIDGFFDPMVRVFEVAAVPELWKEGCNILIALGETIPQHMNPYLSRIYTVITYHLEQPSTTTVQKVFFLNALQSLLGLCQSVDHPILPNRMVKAVLPFITVILGSKTAAAPVSEPTGGSKNSRKRARNYEGDEVFKTTRDIICPTAVEGKLFMYTLEVLRNCLKNPCLDVPQVSLASRILLSIQLAMSQMAPGAFSSNPVLFDQVNKKVQSICVELASSSSIALHKATPLIIASLLEVRAIETLPALDLLLHPRLPPMVRPVPSVQGMSLFRIEESQEEIDARARLHLGYTNEEPIQPGTTTQDVVMDDVPQVTNTVTPQPQKVVPVVGSFFGRTAPAKPQTTQPAPIPAVPSSMSTQVDAPKEQPITSSMIQKSTAQAPLVQKAQPAAPIFPVAPVEEEEEEDMPTIDMGSDSEDED